MKLSEEMAEWRGDKRARAAIDTAIFGPLTEKAAALEAELERLRAGKCLAEQEVHHLNARNDAYRAAVAELRKWYLVSGATCTMTRIFDSLPKDDEP